MRPKNRHLELDILRILATISIIVYHSHVVAPTIDAHGVTKYLFLAVDVFFVLSGFFVGGSILNSTEKKITIKTIAYRISRLFILTTIFLCVAIFYTQVGSKIQTPGSEEILSALTLTYNIYAANLPSYFTVNDLSGLLLIHMWSISIEAQFYIFSLILLITKKQSLRITISAVFLLSSLSLFLLTNYDYFSFFHRYWQFLAGLVVATQNKKLILTLVSLLLFSAAINISSESVLYLHLISTCISSLVIFALSQNTIQFTNRFFQKFKMSEVLLPVFIFHTISIIWTAPFFPAIMTSILCGTLIYALESIWLTRLRHQVEASRICFSQFFISIFTLAFIGNSIFQHKDSGSFNFADFDTTNKKICNFDATTICTVNHHINTKESQRIILLGDSHAATLSDSLRRYSQKNDVVFYQLTQGGCSLIYGMTTSLPNELGLDSNKSNCSKGASVSHKFLETAGPSHIIYSSWLTMHVNNSFDMRQDIRLSPEQFSLKTSNYLIDLEKKWGHRVLVVGPKPELKKLPNNQIQENRSTVPLEFREEIYRNSIERAAPLSQIFQKLNAHGIESANAINLFCEKSLKTCRADITQFYSDKHHFNGRGADLIFEELLKRKIQPYLN